MPHFAIEVEETYQNILRPAIYSITKDLLDVTGFEKETDIHYLGFAKQVVNGQSVIGEEKKKSVNFGHGNRLSVESIITYSQDTIFDTRPYRGNYQNIFHDEALDIVLAPVHYERTVELNLKLRCEDRPTAQRWISQIRRKVGQGLQQMQHRVDYHYPIPDVMIKVLHYLYNLRETQGGYGETFSDWLDNNSYLPLALIGNMAGKGQTIVVKQGQIGILGQWALDPTPEIEKHDSGDVYVASFNYKFKIDQPSTITLSYPLLVHNQLIDIDYRDEWDGNVNLVFGTPDKLHWGLQMVSHRRPNPYPYKPFTMPSFDHWEARLIPLGTTGLFTAMVCVDPNEPTDIMTLNELGDDYSLAPWIYEMMVLFRDDLTCPNQTPILASLYKGDIWTDGHFLEVNEHLHFTTKSPMDIRGLYHVRLSIYTDLTLLSEKTLRKLRSNGSLCQDLLRALGPDILNDVPKISTDGTMPKLPFWNFIKRLRDTNPMYKSNEEVRRLAIGTFIIKY